MIKKLIVAAMLIATFGIGSVAYAQATSGSPGHAGIHKGRHHRRTHRRGTHRLGGKKETPSKTTGQPPK